jgi:hypothetical protein
VLYSGVERNGNAMNHNKIGLIALALVLFLAGGLPAAEKVVFPGGHSILVQRTQVVDDQIVLHLLEGGTIALPRSAVESREYLDREEALKEWKKGRGGDTVTSNPEGKTARDLTWQEKMRILESGPPPVDTGTEPEVEALLNRSGFKGAAGSTGTIAPYGVSAPTELDLVPPGQERDLRGIRLQMAPGNYNATGLSPRAAQRARVQRFFGPDGEPTLTAGRSKAWDRSALGVE